MLLLSLSLRLSAFCALQLTRAALCTRSTVRAA
jgi:hypothetical protein